MHWYQGDRWFHLQPTGYRSQGKPMLPHIKPYASMQSSCVVEHTSLTYEYVTTYNIEKYDYVAACDMTTQGTILLPISNYVNMHIR